MSVIKKILAYLKKAKLEYIIIVSALVLDLLSKTIIQSTMQEGQTVTLIPKFLNFTFCYNNKAAFSFDFGLGSILGAQGVIIAFIVLTVIAVGGFGYFLYRIKDSHWLGRVALALIIGGALGNLWDRIFIGQVRDFIEIVYFGFYIEILGGYSFAIFNIADACLTVGVIAFIVFVLFYDKELKKTPKAEKDSNSIQENNDEIKTENTNG